MGNGNKQRKAYHWKTAKDDVYKAVSTSGQVLAEVWQSEPGAEEDWNATDYRYDVRVFIGAFTSARAAKRAVDARLRLPVEPLPLFPLKINSGIAAVTFTSNGHEYTVTPPLALVWDPELGRSVWTQGQRVSITAEAYDAIRKQLGVI